MTKHTPGPWIVEWPTPRECRVQRADRTNREVVAQIWCNREANAALIIAAPDMLEALQTLIDGDHSPEAWSKVNNAIAKAKAHPRDERFSPPHVSDAEAWNKQNEKFDKLRGGP